MEMDAAKPLACQAEMWSGFSTAHHHGYCSWYLCWKSSRKNVTLQVAFLSTEHEDVQCRSLTPCSLVREPIVHSPLSQKEILSSNLCHGTSHRHSSLPLSLFWGKRAELILDRTRQSSPPTSKRKRLIDERRHQSLPFSCLIGMERGSVPPLLVGEESDFWRCTLFASEKLGLSTQCPLAVSLQ